MGNFFNSMSHTVDLSYRKDIPLCDFPGSDIYMATLEMVRLESAFEDFMHSEG